MLLPGVWAGHQQIVPYITSGLDSAELMVSLLAPGELIQVIKESAKQRASGYLNV